MFIEMYRERSFLWEPIDSLYKNRNKRNDELIEIAVSFGIKECDVVKKNPSNMIPLKINLIPKINRPTISCNK